MATLHLWENKLRVESRPAMRTAKAIAEADKWVSKAPSGTIRTAAVTGKELGVHTTIHYVSNQQKA